MNTQVKAAPEHLLMLNWFELEETRALSVLEEMQAALKLIDEKLSPRRVHEVRVVIRRWYSVWDILKVDNWRDHRYDKKVGKPLTKLNKALGRLRDLDVNIELATAFHAPTVLLSHWRRLRNKRRRKVAEKLASLKAKRIGKELAEHLSRRAYEIERLLIPLSEDEERSATANHTLSPLAKSSYHHLAAYLERCEEEARVMASQHLSYEELHELRLIIKRWRYLLAEFFGLTNLELVKVQQLLGKHHDLVRLREEIENFEKKQNSHLSGDEKKKLKQTTSRITLELARLDDVIEKLKPELPYGLRPYRLSQLIG